MGQSFSSRASALLRTSNQQTQATPRRLQQLTAEAGAQSVRPFRTREPSTLISHQATVVRDWVGFLLSLEVSRLRFEEGQAIGSFFCSIRKLKSHFFCTS